MTKTFFLHKLMDEAAIRAAQNDIWSPYATILDRLIGAESASRACDAVEDLVKVSTQLSFLSLLMLAKHYNVELPSQIANRVRDKWLGGTHDLTEGERLDFIKRLVPKLTTQLIATPRESVFQAVFPGGDYSDWDRLKDFKVTGSHLPSGGDTWMENKLRAIAPDLLAFLDRLKAMGRINLVLVAEDAGRTLVGTGPSRRWPRGDTPSGVYLRLE